QTDAAAAVPVIDAVMTLKKTDRFAAFQPRTIHRYGMQGAGVNGVLDTIKFNHVVQQSAQRAVIQQRDRIVLVTPANNQAAGQACQRTGYTPEVGTVDMVAAEIHPDAFQVLDTNAVIVGIAGQCHAINSDAGRAENKIDGVVMPVGQNFINGFENAYLIGRPGPAAGQNQPSFFYRHVPYLSRIMRRV